jgi:hypothetical protein
MSERKATLTEESIISAGNNNDFASAASRLSPEIAEPFHVN